MSGSVGSKLETWKEKVFATVFPADDHLFMFVEVGTSENAIGDLEVSISNLKFQI
jgi:hypothetical protein